MNSDREKQEPELELQLQKVAPKHALSAVSRYALMAWIAGAVSLLALHFSDTGSFGTGGITPSSFQRGDKLSTGQRAEIDGKFAGYTARLAPLALTDKKVREEFLAFPYLKPEVKEQLLKEALQGDRKVAAVTLWDNFEEDGDVVSISSDGISMIVPIFHAPTTVYLPYRPGSSLTITGVRDGGGGITVAIETAAGAVPLPVMGVGQTIVIPLM